jgi:hypothetical protein
VRLPTFPAGGRIYALPGEIVESLAFGDIPPFDDLSDGAGEGPEIRCRNLKKSVQFSQCERVAPEVVVGERTEDPVTERGCDFLKSVRGLSSAFPAASCLWMRGGFCIFRPRHYNGFAEWHSD